MRQGESSWVTIASNDIEAWKALVLAKSLKSVYTSRSITIGITEDVSPEFRSILEKTFNLVVPIYSSEIYTKNEVSSKFKKSWLKIWCWKLVIWRKCIFLNPNSLVLENADELFTKNDQFSMVHTDSNIDGPGIFISRPNLDAFDSMIELAEKIQKPVYAVFQKHFNISNTNIIDETIYRTEDGIKDPFLPKIVHFDSEPWEKVGDNSIINIAKKKWLEIFLHYVIPATKLEKVTTTNFFLSSLKHFGIPVSNGPTKQIENIELGELKDTVAVIGVAGKFPGANTVEEFWNIIKNGIDPICQIPRERPNSSKGNYGEAGYLKCSVDEFDSKFFEISPRDVELMDPQQRILLETIWEALENSSIDPQKLHDTNASMFLGVWQQDYVHHVSTSDDYIRKYLGNEFSATASRISNFLGMFGPNFALESGCSSSASAIHLACKSLQEFETNLSLVGGVNLILWCDGPLGTSMEDSPVLSKSFRCKTFDESADGFVRAEGCVTVILKRYSDARYDGDNILGIIRGTALNNDGHGTCFGTPNPTAQERVFREALHNANVSPNEVSLIEAHGTGTQVGDPIEAYAITQVYKNSERDQPLLISSVKSNIGHTESCAGLVGLTKILLSMKYSLIPPNLHLRTLNPRIDLDLIPAKIPIEPTEWKFETGKPRIASLNSFGLSGTNVNIIIQEPPENLEINSMSHTGVPEMVQISAKSYESLDELVKRYITYLQTDNNASDIKIDDLAYHTNVGRASLSHRLTVIANNTIQLLDKLIKKSYISDKISPQKPKICFLFSGQGSQYFGMTKILYEKFIYFRIPFDYCNTLIQNSLGVGLSEILWEKAELLEKTLYCQPAIFCIEYSLVQFWKSFGIEPDYVLGHSIGEFAAATTAGVLSVEEALTLVIERSKLFNELGRGGMLVVRASQEAVIPLIQQFEKTYCGQWADIAAINSAEEVVVSGETDSIKNFAEFLLTHKIKSIKIQAQTAFHSRDMDSILSKFRSIIIEKINIKEPKCKYISGTLAKLLDSVLEFGPDYWVRHLRDTVRFSEAIKLLWQESKVLVEIGPQPILLGLTMANVTDPSSGSFIPLLRKNEEDSQAIFSALSKHYLAGTKICWRKWFGRRQTKLSLPTYPFQRQKFWYNSDESESEFLDMRIPHPLLGRLIQAPVPDNIFTQKYQLKEFKFVGDHKVAGRVILPGAAYLETMLAASREIITRESEVNIPMIIQNFNIEAPLELDKTHQIRTIMSPEQENLEGRSDLLYKISIHKQISANKWKRHAVGCFKPNSDFSSRISQIDLDAIKRRSVFQGDLEPFYKQICDNGIEFGPSFKSLLSGWTGTNEALTKILLPKQHDKYICHPIILDAMIQTLFFGLASNAAEIPTNDNDLRLPISIRKFTYLPNELTNELYIYTNFIKSEETVILVNNKGICIGIMEGIDYVKTSKDSFVRALTEEKLNIPYFLEEIWLPKSGLTTNRVNLNLFQISTTQLNLNNISSPIQDKEPNAQKALDKCFFYFLLRGIQECDWEWPKLGDIISPDKWLDGAPKHLKRIGLFDYFMEILAEENYLEPLNDETNEFKVIKNLPSPHQCELEIKEMLGHILELDEPAALFCKRCDTCFNNVLSGQMSPLEYLFPQDPKEYGAIRLYSESGIYASVSEIAIRMILDVIVPSSSEPSHKVIRILEVGAGSGKSSAQLMEKLNDLKIPFHYTFTDISQTFLTEASKKFDQNVSFGILNLENDPLAQGYSPESFDVILAAQVIHATSNIVQSLKSCNQLLREGGIIVLSEQFKSTYTATLSFGFLDGWWNFKDFRKSSPIIDSQKWVECLNEAGFEESNTISLANGAFGGVIGKKTILSHTSTNNVKTCWVIVSDNPILEEFFMEKIEKYGRFVKRVKFDTNLLEIGINPEENIYKLNPKHKSHFDFMIKKLNSNIEGILYIWTENHEEYLIPERQEIYCGGLLHFCQSIIQTSEPKKKPRLNFITKGLHIFGDESYGPVDPSTGWALFKVLMNETDLNVKLFDISEDPKLHFLEREELFLMLWKSDKEVFNALRGGKTFVQRLVNVDKKIVPLTIPNSDRFQAVNPKTNSFKDISISSASRKELKGNEVEVNVKSASMNFRDLFIVLKPEGFPLPECLDLGYDFSGVVTAVGKEVTRFQLGDEVIGASWGAYASHSIGLENQLIKKPENMSFESASTILCVLFTTYYSLKTCANLNSSDKILIHAASGGVGLCAIQFAKRLGAEIFATAGSKKKRTFLRNLGIKNVYHSRNTKFAEQILKNTNGLGVSVVLNSLTGPGFKEASLKTCGKNARFVEIGKINVWTESEIKALRPDVGYFFVDIGDKLNEMKQLFVEFEDYFSKCVSSGVNLGLPHITYPLDLIHEAFQNFQKTKHVGKIIIKIPEAILGSDGNWEFVHEIFNLRSTYLITGGLGGIGIELTRWMTTSGAKHIVLVGRNPPSKQVEEIITQLNSLGNNIITVQANVGDYSQCAGILDIIKSMGLPPLRGIFHAAGVLSDSFIINQSWDKFTHTFSSKVYAAWNLHQLTLDYDLEYFVNFSSGCAILGFPGQSNHCAANTYLDAITHYRLSIGLQAQTINFGAWSDIGAAAHIKMGTEGLYGMQSFTPSQGINGIEKILREKHSQLLLLGETDWNIIKQYIKFGNYFERLQSHKPSTSLDISEKHAKVIEKIRTSKPEERQEEIENFLEALLQQLLRLPPDEKIDKDQNFSELGVDSLIGMEMRNYLQVLMKDQTISISAMENNRTIRTLAEHLAELMN